MSSDKKMDLPKSPLDLWKLMGGKAHRVKTEGASAEDSLLAVYKDRFTFTFILGHEVASIHFDRLKREIFFKGHNLKNLELNQEQIEALRGLETVLEADERGKSFLSHYKATLDSLLADTL